MKISKNTILANLIICTIWFFPLVSFGANPISNPLSNVSSINDLIATIVEAVVVVLTPIAVAFLIFGGFKLVSAQGDKTKLTEGKKAITGALIGIAILLGAELLAKLIETTVKDLGSGVF